MFCLLNQVDVDTIDSWLCSKAVFLCSNDNQQVILFYKVMNYGKPVKVICFIYFYDNDISTNCSSLVYVRFVVCACCVIQS